MDDPPHPLLAAAYRDPLRTWSVDGFTHEYERDLTALRAALLALSIEKPIRFRFRGNRHVVLPFDPQLVGHDAVGVLSPADDEEMIALPRWEDDLESGPPLIGAEEPTHGPEGDDEAYELLLSTPAPAMVIVRAPNPEAARAIFHTRRHLLERDILQSERDLGANRTLPLDLDDVEIREVTKVYHVDVASLPILYR